MTIVVLELTGRCTADVYRFAPVRGPDGRRDFGWAICTVNDATGELLITSDWGNFAHRWNTDHLGAPTLTAFIAHGSRDYLTRKLLREGTDAREFCSEKTARALQTRIAERRLEDGRGDSEWRRTMICRAPSYITKEIAREIWDELDELAGTGTGQQAAALFFERLPSELHAYISEPWEYSQTIERMEYRVLYDSILPALVAACRATVIERSRMAIERSRPEVAMMTERGLVLLKTCTCDNSLGSSVACRGVGDLGSGWCCALTGERGRLAALKDDLDGSR